MASMKKLGKANHERENDSWHFLNEVKSDQDLSDEISKYFAGISGTFTPINHSLLPRDFQSTFLLQENGFSP